MVDALREARRVLKPGGCLLDLRPVAMDLPVEVLASSRREPAPPPTGIGVVGGAPGIEDDLRVSRALGVAVASDWFVQERVTFFTLSCYWDSADELEAFLERHWRRRYRRPEDSCFEEARTVMGAMDRPSRLRIRQVLTLSRYRASSRREGLTRTTPEPFEGDING